MKPKLSTALLSSKYELPNNLKTEPKMSASGLQPADGNAILLKLDEYMLENDRLAEIYKIKNKEIKM